ncbi:hypothetical protein Q8A67_022429 [Cirrhinus molitorella]|uniref:Uncharacterized protein n=1 Tax=Cirrhinus molitorella TaxID=172907 RepID=A0AA88P8U0_9TELE|nr:hypothetical protein Q8A67_022429 [Cirrhinus molitorella]
MRKCSSASVPFLFSICTFSVYHPVFLPLSPPPPFSPSLWYPAICVSCASTPPLHPPPLSPRAPDPPRAPPPPLLPLRGAGFVG